MDIFGNQIIYTDDAKDIKYDNNISGLIADDVQDAIDELNTGVTESIAGPNVSTDNAIARYDGTTGLLTQNSGVLIDDSNNINGVNDLTIINNLTMTGTTSTFTPPKLTTAQRTALSPNVGNVIYNTTTKALNIYSNNSWVVPGDYHFQPISNSELTGATVPMTSAVLPAPYVVTASSSADAARTSWKLFDQVLTTSWLSGTGLYGNYNGTYATDLTGTGLTGITQTGAWNTIALPAAATVNKYRMYPRSDSGTVYNGHPYEWNLIYSMDDVTWASAHFVTGQTNVWPAYLEFDITPVTAPYWGVQISKASGTSATTFAGFGELRLYNSELMISTDETGVSIGSSTAPTEIGGNLTVIGDTRISTKTPASAAATGTVGTIAYDSGFIYICTATNTWKQVAISSWVNV